LSGEGGAELVADDAVAGPAATGDAVVALRGAARYHRPSCLLVTGKRASPVTTGQAQLEPCEMCLP